eukprot:COSAG02_NODE_8206_length_2660_cov_1.436548_2_plen_88_part_00
MQQLTPERSLLLPVHAVGRHSLPVVQCSLGANRLAGALAWRADANAKGCEQPGKAECGNATGTVPQISALELLSASIGIHVDDTSVV